jgi:K(+)-stimulated pyrophosphate-energized sodium pump
MNILIKLTCLIGLVIAPMLGGSHGSSDKKACCTPQEKVAHEAACAKASHADCDYKAGSNKACCSKEAMAAHIAKCDKDVADHSTCCKKEGNKKKCCAGKDKKECKKEDTEETTSSVDSTITQ